MGVSRIARGVEYITMTQTIGRPTAMHIVRIQTQVTPCIIGSLLNPRDPQGDKNAPIYYRRRTANLRGAIDGTLVLPRLRSTRYPLQYQGRQRWLSPVWISNGMLFGDAGGPTSRIYGPVVQRGVAEVDTTVDLAGKGDKGRGVVRRAYTHRLRYQTPLLTNFSENNPPRTAVELSALNTEVIGGAGFLIEEGAVHTTSYWETIAGGSFDDGVWNTCGPVVAQSYGPSPVYYMIICEERVNWTAMAPYLKNSFPADIDAARYLSPRQTTPIRNATVYDGGDSRQVWVARQRPDEVVYITTPTPKEKNHVPHYLCAWALL